MRVSIEESTQVSYTHPFFILNNCIRLCVYMTIHYAMYNIQLLYNVQCTYTRLCSQSRANTRIEPLCYKEIHSVNRGPMRLIRLPDSGTIG